MLVWKILYQIFVFFPGEGKMYQAFYLKWKTGILGKTVSDPNSQRPPPPKKKCQGIAKWIELSRKKRNVVMQSERPLNTARLLLLFD